MKHNDHFTFKPVIDNWDTHSDENINSSVILFFDEVCTDSPVIIMLQKSKQTNKYNEKLGILSLIRYHRKKEVGKQGRLPTPADILVLLVDI